MAGGRGSMQSGVPTVLLVVGGAVLFGLVSCCVALYIWRLIGGAVPGAGVDTAPFP